MKKSIFYVFLVVFGFAIFSSCSDDKKDPATPASVITFTDNVNSASVASTEITLNISGTVVATNKIAQVKLMKGSTALQTVTTFASPKNYVFNWTVSLLGLSGTVTYTVQVTDSANLTSTKDFVVTITPASGSDLMSNQRLGKVYNFMTSAPNCSAWDLVNNVAVLGSASSTTKDMSNTTVAPGPAPYNFTDEVESKTTTKFVLAVDFNYLSPTVTAAAAAYAAGTPSTKITIPGFNVYVAKLRDGNYAVIKFSSPVCTTTTNDDYMQFTYKKVN